jgi:3'-phosphoadenosine 5'-phosphosulfate sulfotransferase (PAPS reductase)/FAD synthetase
VRCVACGKSTHREREGMSEPARIVSWFSCGAASAVATKLAIAQYGSVDVVRCYVAEEHPDNERFAADCEAWFGQPITTLQNEKYGSSAYEVVRQRGFWSSPEGAPCTRILKREAREAYQRPTDRHILGYTADTIDVGRWDSFLDANNIDAEAPLIDRGVTHSDCLAMVERAGIQLPTLYLQGFTHNNCIGCTKAGGQGYWNKVRIHYPERFHEARAITNKLGARPLMVNGTRKSLDELDPNGGDDGAPEIQCGVFCHMAEQEYAV